MQDVTETLIMTARAGRGDTLGHYALVREAGRGGMSVVHEARDTRTGRTVALKVLAVPPGLPPEQAADMVARFEREARAVAGLSHPNIVAIHQLGEEGGRHFLVMEYLRGETLRQRLGRGPLAPAQALPVLRQIADAVDAVHAQGVVHRDIKPSNVMLLADGTAKLLDFGVARQSDDATITGTGALVGSPAYMAPEQVRGGAGTPASDLWALGALLYEMLAGHPPFTGKNIPAVLYQVSHEAPAPVAGLTTPVQRVLRRALEKNPARRYSSARALAESLAATLAPRRALPPVRPAAALAVGAVALLGLGVAALHDRRLGRHKIAPRPAILEVTPRPPILGESEVSERLPDQPSLRRVRGEGASRRLATGRLATGRLAARTLRKKTRAVTKPRAASKSRAARPRHAPRPRAARPSLRQATRAATVRRPEVPRRAAPVYVFPERPQPPRHTDDDFDAQASEALQKYIYPVGH